MTETRKRVTSSETEATRERAAPEANGGMEPDHNLQARIADRAYELYLQRGEKEGHAMDDWLQAEREITGGASTGDC